MSDGVGPEPIIAIGLGEVLWDLLPSGMTLGGAPANFAYHMDLHGANGVVLSRVGTDDLGDQIVSSLADLGLSAANVQRDPENPTGTVTVHLDSSQTATYTIHESVAWDHIQFSDGVHELSARANVVCFGSLCQRSKISRDTIRRVVSTTPHHAVRVFDVNLRQKYYTREVIDESFRLANVVKLNDEELPVVSSLLGVSGPESVVIRRLVDGYELRLFVLTRGENGSTLVTATERSDLPGASIDVVDTVGAGDAFTAATVWGLICNAELGVLHERARGVASYVCTQRGGTPVVPEHLLS